MDNHSPILIAKIMYDFLPIFPAQEPINNLFRALQTKYKITNLGHPNTYLKWHINTTNEGHIHLSRPHFMQVLLHKTRITQANPRHTPLPENLNWKHAATAPPPPPSCHNAFRQIIGDL
eukprot:GFKZ01000227.1.p1 GENE.GFKZ01000227.1~~GFKZ01000227.1.p1  ORF type:complete len:119 (+),score=2.37 GFKZ01000227.1:326-682(+)